MNVLFAILVAIGIGVAIGLRPFLPVLLVGALAHAGVAIDLAGTRFNFLTSWIFLLAVVACIALLDAFGQRRSNSIYQRGWLMRLSGVAAITLGALEGAAVADDRASLPLLGALLGAIGAILAFSVATTALRNASERLDRSGASLLSLYAEAAALVVALAVLLLPPFGALAVSLIGWMGFGQRRKARRKYAGLRILR